MPELSAEELNIIYQIRRAIGAETAMLAELPGLCVALVEKAEDQHSRILTLIAERDRYQFRADQKWRCRKEINAALDISEGMDADEALRVALTKIKELQNGDKAQG